MTVDFPLDRSQIGRPKGSQSEKPLYLDPGQGRYAIEPLEALRDRELAELDAVLRAKLHAKDPDLFTVVPLIARYASTNLLAHVLVVFRRAEGRWACDVQNAALPAKKGRNPQ